MTNSKNVIKSIAGVVASNIATIISGIIIGFIIPKVISVEGYGLFKTFSLYTTYVGLFSMGIIDGIVLEYGGYNYSQFDRKLFRSYFKWYILVHLIWVGFILIISVFFEDQNSKFICLMIAVYLFFSNIVGYFQQISQITQRFKEYSKAKIIQSAMKVLGGIIMIGLFFVTKELVDYRYYVVLSTLGFVFIAIGYAAIYKEIIWGDSLSLNNTKKQIIHLSKTGFPLMFANLCTTFILTLDRQFVNILFPNEEYAIYAFAYNLLSLVTVATSAVSTVLYPVLKRISPDKLKSNYSYLISTMLVFVFCMLLIYFPLCAFIRWFLPKYVDSIIIFRVIFPGLAINASINVVMHNYYKALGKNSKYFRKSIIVLLLSALANGIAYLCFNSTVSISVASIFVMIIWYLFIEQFFVSNYGYSRWRNLSYLILMIASFYVITIIDNWVVSGIIYLFVFLIMALLIQKRSLLSIKHLLTEKT